MWRLPFIITFVLLTRKVSASGDSIYYRPFRNFLKEAILPTDIPIKKSNNNVDIIRYNNKFYLAFRSASRHFPSADARLIILSSTDRLHWHTELIVHLEADVREPRFFVLNNSLWLYFFKGGRSRFRFDPQQVFAYEYTSDSEQWKKYEIPSLQGYVPWRIKVYQNKAYLSAYHGQNLYKASHQGDLRLFVSNDGKNWQPISPLPQIAESGAEEGEFEFDSRGNLWGVVRMEGKGAYVVYAHKDSLSHWKRYLKKHKYDSALMFRHKQHIYLISRRNVPGEFARAPEWLPYWIQHKYNLLHYWFSSKVTALFRLNPTTKEMEHLLDFPSTGDNAFPAITQLSDTSYLIFNYSSDYTKGQKTWLKGQLGNTYIYATELIFPSHAD